MKTKFTLVATAAILLTAAPFAAQSQALTLSQGLAATINDPISGRNASLVFAGGYGQIDFTQGNFLQSYDPDAIDGAQRFFNAAKSTMVGKGSGAVTNYSRATQDDNPIEVPYDTAWQSRTASTLSVNITDGSTAQFGVLNLSGGLTLSVAKSAGVQGGTLTVDNLRVDLINHQVIGDLSGARVATGRTTAEVFNRPDTPIWTFASQMAGPTSVRAESLVSADAASIAQANGFTVVDSKTTTIYQQTSCFSGGSGLGYVGGAGGYYYPCSVPAGTAQYLALRSDLVLSDLELTADAAQILSGSLNFSGKTDAVTALDQVNSSAGKWGSMRVGLFFQAGNSTTAWPALPASIPEPSTYALMGLGLAAVLVARRQRA